MNFIIIKVCCFDCDKFLDMYNINCDSPRDFITSFSDYDNYDYYIFQDNMLCERLKGLDLFALINKKED